MVKLLRKYNKYILVVGGSMLMIAFLVPQAFNTLIGDPANKAYAHLDGAKVSLRDHDRYQREFHALESFNQGLVRGVIRCDSVDHWMLLSREAQDAGLVGQSGDGAAWTELNNAMESNLAMQLCQARFQDKAREKWADETTRNRLLEEAHRQVEEQKAGAAGSSNLTPSQFNEVLAKARGIFRLRLAFEGAPRFSDRRAVALKRQRFEGAVVESLIIPAERIASSMPEPTADEVAAQFAKYRDAAPGSGEYGFGYRLPPRMKLEWLTIDRAAIEKAVPDDAVEANRRWRNDRKRYPGEFAAEQARIEAQIRKERVDKIAADIDVLVRGEIKRASARLDADGIYKKLPPDWAARRPKLEDIAQSVVKAVKENAGVDIPVPAVTVQAGKWLTDTEVSELPGIGLSQVSLGGGRTLPFHVVAFLAREFNRPDAAEVAVGLQVGLTNADLVAIDRSARHYFTILDFRPESAPDSLDEVRAQVVEDVRKFTAYQRLVQLLPVYEALASKGLDDVKKTVDTEFPMPPVPEIQPGQRVTGPQALHVNKREFIPRFIPTNDNPNDSPRLRAAVMAIMDRIDPTKPVTDVPAEERTVTAEIPRVLSVQIAQLIGVQPATFEMMRATGDQQVMSMQREQIDTLTRQDPALDPFRFEALKDRWKFKLEAQPDAAS